MSAVAEPRAQTHAEHQFSPLVIEVAHMRALLEAYRDGRPAPAAPRSPLGSRETALARLEREFALSAFERQIVLLAAAVELDGGIASLAAAVQGGDDPRPTFGLALAALPGAHWDALAPGSPLRHWRLVNLGAGPTLASRPLTLDERVLHELTGMPALDERLLGVASLAPPHAQPAASHWQLAGELAQIAVAADAPVAIQLDGDDLEARGAVAGELAQALEARALAIRGSALAPAGPELATQALLVDREALLAAAVPVIDVDGTAESVVAALLGLLRSPLVVIVGDYAGRTDGRVRLHRSVQLPTPAEQRSLWSRALGAPPAGELAAAVEDVAQHFRLGAASVDAIARELGVTEAPDGDTASALRHLCRERTRARLDGLAERIDPGATWDDLVLPAGHRELLHEIAHHVRHRTQVYEGWGFGERTSRGLGVTALFAGDSGTGKTLAAEVLAHELALDLYRIDLSATVSKYIGETEKNLRRLFDEAESSGAVLLFDEAEALFAKRGEVKDSHDRYANLEVAYLLQRMESYRGLAILTTNLRSNVDRAFLRRLRFVIQFPFPHLAEREAMWQRAFPPATPLDGIDPKRLAQLTVSGGAIRSIALAAAFAAAQDGGAVGRAHLLRATRLEFAKAERPQPDYMAAGLE